MLKGKILKSGSWLISTLYCSPSPFVCNRCCSGRNLSMSMLCVFLRNACVLMNTGVLVGMSSLMTLVALMNSWGMMNGPFGCMRKPFLSLYKSISLLLNHYVLIPSVSEPITELRAQDMEIAEPKLAKRDHRGLWSCFHLKTQRRVTAAETMEVLRTGRVISTEEEEEVNGVVRVKVVMSRQELKQMLALMRHKRGDAADRHRVLAAAGAQGFEKSLHALRRRHMKRVESMKGRSVWIPALQSIPEEN
ncbi:hypothetical protein Cni_G07542 [Canna indica]|uniref:Uncharacterized protein n=1 Tax=Canna indica TaxID=4628 RepID=A0AAQ3Q6Z5_9LILI|nr:hypothetical protein Cni_G07542 [Canna indica]